MELHKMDDGGGWPDDPVLPILEEIDRDDFYDDCSIGEFLSYYTNKSKDEVSNLRWVNGKSSTVFWHQKEDESEAASTACPSDSLLLANYMGGRTTPTHEPNKETLQHKIISVLRSLSLPKYSECLIQLWAPTKIRGHMLLTTSAQPFGLSYSINSDEEEESPPEQPHPHNYLFHKGLCRYRKRCLGVMYDVTDHGGNTESGGGGSSSTSSQQQQQLLQFGPPERVFKQGFPERSPNIGHYNPEEFPQLQNYAINECGIETYLALPLFESTGGHHCLGVLEIVSVRSLFFQFEDISAVSFLETLESAHLRSLPPHFHECSKIRKDALSSRVDIKELLKIVREVHQLPLVQAWVSCMCDDHAFKTTNLFCEAQDYDSDNEDLAINMDSIHNYGGFFIQEGKGLVGRAYSVKKPCFCRDTSQFSISDYPILHFTSEACLTACVAIPLHVLHPSLDALVLEIFLPHTLEKYSSERYLLPFLKYLLSTIINEFSRHDVSLGLQQWDQVFSVELVSSSSDDDDDVVDDKFTFFNICGSGGDLNRHHGINVANDKTTANVRKKQHSSSTTIVAPSKRQGIAGTSRPRVYADARARITLDVLKLHFDKNLEDAAQSLEVSRSTLKRICRELNIARWPSHKRKKVDHHIASSHPGLQAGGCELVEEVIQESRGGNPSIDASLEKEAAARIIQESEGGNPSINASLEKDEAAAPIIQESGRGNSSINASLEKYKAAAPIIQESMPGNPSINASLEKDEAAAPINPTSAANGKTMALGHENGDNCGTSMMVEATYKEKNVVFPLPCNSGIEHLSHNIAKRFKLQVEGFTIEYEDEDGDWIMIACDEDLHFYHIKSSKSSGQEKIKLSVIPKINGAE